MKKQMVVALMLLASGMKAHNPWKAEVLQNSSLHSVGHGGGHGPEHPQGEQSMMGDARAVELELKEPLYNPYAQEVKIQKELVEKVASYIEKLTEKKLSQDNLKLLAKIVTIPRPKNSVVREGDMGMLQCNSVTDCGNGCSAGCNESCKEVCRGAIGLAPRPLGLDNVDYPG